MHAMKGTKTASLILSCLLAIGMMLAATLWSSAASDAENAAQGCGPAAGAGAAQGGCSCGCSDQQPAKLQALLPDIRDANSPKMAALYKAALGAYQKRQWPQMATSAKEVLAARGRTPNEVAFGHLLLGQALLQQKKFEAADAEFAKVARIPIISKDRDAYRGTAIFLSGWANFQGQQYPKAADQFTAVLKQYPRLRITSNAVRLATDALSKSGRASAAPALLTSVAQKAPKTETASQALWYAGVEYEREQKLTPARQAFQKLIRDYPNTPPAKAAKERIKSLGANGKNGAVAAAKGSCCQ